MPTKGLDYIQQMQIVKLFALGNSLNSVKKQLHISIPTLCKYKEKLKAEIEESRESIRKKMDEVCDTKIAAKCLKIADTCTSILDKSLTKYQTDNKEFKTGELTQISMIGAIAIDKNRVIENKPSNRNINPVVFNFQLAQPGKQGENLQTIAINQPNNETIELQPITHKINPKRPKVIIKTIYHDGRDSLNNNSDNLTNNLTNIDKAV